jgi:hypothetical protein
MAMDVQSFWPASYNLYRQREPDARAVGTNTAFVAQPIFWAQRGCWLQTPLGKGREYSTQVVLSERSRRFDSGEFAVRCLTGGLQVERFLLDFARSNLVG